MLSCLWTSLQGMDSTRDHAEDACHLLFQVPLSRQSILIHKAELTDFNLERAVNFCIDRPLLRLLTRLNLDLWIGIMLLYICFSRRIFGFFELGLFHHPIEVRHTSLGVLLLLPCDAWAKP